MADPRRGSERGALAVLAKAPIPGYAKTRLDPLLGAEGAAELHAVLLERTLRAAAAAGFGAIAVWCAPDRRSPFFEALRARAAFELRDQPAGDLGARMLVAFEHHLASSEPAVLIGSDCPELGPGELRAVRAALGHGADVVLVPALDGGYAAIGLARVDRSLFDGMRWGTPEVLEETRRRVRRLGWTARELPAVRDVDRPDDVEWLLGSGLLDDGERLRIARHLPRPPGGTR